MPEQTNEYAELHDSLVLQHSNLVELLRQKSECLESVQQSKFPATQLPKIMQALQSQHEWEQRMTEALENIINAIGLAAMEGEEDGTPA